MKILVHSRVFLPSYGGLEKMMDMIAAYLASAGHDVTVVTNTASAVDLDKPYRIVRSPGISKTISLARAADICLVANITLRTTPLLLSIGATVVTSHQGWYDPNTQGKLRAGLKNLYARLTHNIYCSSRVQEAVGARGTVIPNSYDESFFFPDGTVEKDRDVLFVGRLVSDKGCDVLIHAIHRLAAAGSSTNLTIVGDGDELRRLDRQVRELGLDDRVAFKGKLEGRPLADEMRRHRILAVPSLWEEPFGIVALEGAACGCVVIGTNGGGLPQAIGPCGLVVERGDAPALADAISAVLGSPEMHAQFTGNSHEHLAAHTSLSICRRYADELARIAGSRGA